MKQSLPRRWPRDHVVLNRPPLHIPPEYIVTTAEVIKGKTVLLCPVNKLNKLPKALLLGVQGEFDFVDKPVNKLFLVGPDGRVYRVPPKKTQDTHKI